MNLLYNFMTIIDLIDRLILMSSDFLCRVVFVGGAV